MQVLKERELITLGALLHDIGKFRQRASNKEIQEEEIPTPSNVNFGYKHAEISYKEILRLKNLLNLDESDFLKVLVASLHHQPQSNFNSNEPEYLKIYKAIYRLSDWYASTERSQMTDVEGKKEFKRLRPVFEIINIENSNKPEIGKYYYRLEPLKVDILGKDKLPAIFPEPEEAKAYEQVEKLSKSYSRLWMGDKKSNIKGFMEELKSLLPANKLEHKVLLIYYLLYKYTWCIPASTFDSDRGSHHYSDISLFDHLRVTAALASSLFTDYNIKYLNGFTDRNRELTAQKLKLVVFEGDISGIQKFLYDITNIKGASKRLRGRSAFLSLLPELIARFFLRELRYPVTNVLYTGGGKFQAIVGYEENIYRKLHELAAKVEEELIKAFGGKLGFVIYYQECSLSDMSNYSNIIKKLMESADEEKSRKFHLTIHNFEKFANKSVTEVSSKICPSCRWQLIPEEQEVCEWCRLFEDLGGFLPKAKFLSFNPDNAEGHCLKLGDIGSICFSNKTLLSGENYVINETDIPEGVVGFKFFGRSLPQKGESVKTFEDLASEAKGDKKIAYVKADVDNLGLIFIQGLGENYSISRVATLSRSLDLFFSAYLSKFFEEKYREDVYTVYSGGDDLFFIAPWDKAVDITIRIRNLFDDFTCRNSFFGISCGFFVSGGTYPLRLASDKVSEREKTAKSSNNFQKDSINIFNETLQWRQLKEAIKRTEPMIDLIDHDTIPRTLIYRIYTLLVSFLKGNSTANKMMFYPFFYYTVGRNVRSESAKRKLEELIIDVNNNYAIRKESLFSLKYILMRTRSQGG